MFKSSDIRKTILKMGYSGATAHLGCALSIVEILAVLYRNYLNLNDKTPNSPDRNYLILSKGHGVMALYACLFELGWVSEQHIADYFKNGTSLKGLGDAHVPGVEVTAGSLGHGLSVGVGMAMAAKRSKTGQKAFAIVGDGEMNEGTMWEALLFASHHKLDNLCIIVDENKYQAMGMTDDVLDLKNLADKFSAFGCETLKCDGHNEQALNTVINKLISVEDGKPKAIIARTVKGKGISFMENNNIWHYKKLNKGTYEKALEEVTKE